MGEITNTKGIRSFTPDDTETELYIPANYSGPSLRDLISRCKEKFPNASFDDIEISAEHIHTDCLGYDRYDPGDYTNYIVATWKKK